MRATEAQRQIAFLARTRYREGVANYLEVLDAERNLFTEEQALIQVHRRELDNLISLYIARGGGVMETKRPGTTHKISGNSPSKKKRRSTQPRYTTIGESEWAV